MEESFNLPAPAGCKPQALPGGEPDMSLIRAMLACLPASRLSPNCEGSVEQTLYILNSPTYDRAQGKLLAGNSQDLAESSSSGAEFIPAGVGRP